MSQCRKVLISMPEKFLEAIDIITEEECRSRSEFIREAVRNYINTKHPQVASEVV
jgi:metal-responsive CopG/Arc/MetJ family transcriptional regulator